MSCEDVKEQICKSASVNRILIRKDKLDEGRVKG